MMIRGSWTSVIRNRFEASGVISVASSGSCSQRSISVPHVAPNGIAIRIFRESPSKDPWASHPISSENPASNVSCLARSRATGEEQPLSSEIELVVCDLTRATIWACIDFGFDVRSAITALDDRLLCRTEENLYDCLYHN